MPSQQFPPIGMSPSVWGPIFWTTMHIVTLGYPDTPSKEEQQGVVQFFASLATVIPCPICRTHYAHFLAETPVETVATSRQELIIWLFNLHNKVNEKLGKRAITLNEFIENMRALSERSHITIPPPAISATTAIVGGAGILLGATAVYFYLRGRQ
jgi:hypothetical protein